jgi:hypothetical protein
VITSSAESTPQHTLPTLARGLRNALQVAKDALHPVPKALVDFKEFSAPGPTKRALVSYLVSPLLMPKRKRDRTVFSNFGIAQQVPQVLNQLGYIVDIVRYDLKGWKISERYDLFLGHGGINFEEIIEKLPKETVSIYFSTGIYWKEWNIREAKRLYDLTLRRGCILPPDRPIRQSEEFANRRADGIICLGNEAAVSTYSDFPLVIGINNATYPIAWTGWNTKDYRRGCQHFLFFSGDGNVHKGLDLLLEAFAGTDLQLHICQSIDSEFAALYRYELMESDNIHLHGRLPMRSEQFESLARLCNWAITATCAEGQPGAIIECMGYGLIPILPDSANIDLSELGVRITDCSVETIRKTCLRLAQTSAEDCRRKSIQVAEVVKKDYSPEHFNKTLAAAIQEIIDRSRNSK